jgi:hypothetical protein
MNAYRKGGTLQNAELLSVKGSGIVKAHLLHEPE